MHGWYSQERVGRRRRASAERRAQPITRYSIASLGKAPIGSSAAMARTGEALHGCRPIALDHGHIRSQCENKTIVGSFPQEIVDLACAFVTLQSKRHRADYDPMGEYRKSSVQSDIELARSAIIAFKSEKTSDRRAFCAWVLFRAPRK